MKGAKIFLAIFLALSLSFLSLSLYIHHLLTQPLIQPPTNSIIIELKPNESAAQFVSSLSAQSLISFPRLLLGLIRVQGLSSQLKAGIYELRPGESAQTLIQKIVAGRVLVQFFRIIEGSTLRQVDKQLQAAPFLKYQSSDWQELGIKNPSAEGALLANTYQYPAGSSAINILRRANQKLEECLNFYWQHRQPNLPYRSSYELLIVASILEKETALAEEKKIIAGIIVNRLNKRMPLQMDPTVIYALGENYPGKLSHENLAIDSLYNTYRYRGLPPTPIAMVGEDAIKAAANPILSAYLYFVARGDGSHQFSETYIEQRRAINQYQKRK